jgi:hypothetical protein
LTLVTRKVSDKSRESGQPEYRYLSGRLTRWVCEKIAQNVAQSIFVNITFTPGKKCPKNFG